MASNHLLFAILPHEGMPHKLRRRSGQQEFYEIKSSKPNSDQTKVSKEKMLKLVAANPANQVYFALPDNPYLTREAYDGIRARSQARDKARNRGFRQRRITVSVCSLWELSRSPAKGTVILVSSHP